MSDTLFSVKNLCFCYHNKAVFKGIDLEIPKNTLTAIIGPSGCGKTSFLSCLNRIFELEEGVDTCGEIVYKDKNILSEDCDINFLRSEISMVFQKPTCFPMSIYENLAVVIRGKEFLKSKALEERVTELLILVGLYEEVKNRLHSPARELSGGQQQRLCIARALIGDPQVILFDEPCSALDPIASKGVEDLIVSLSKTKSIIVVTHNMAQAKRIAKYAVIFWANEISAFPLESGTIESLLRNPKEDLTRQYLGGVLG